MQLFYSVDFKESVITHNGNIDYPIECYQNTEPYIESMKAFCDSALKKSLKKWGFTGSDIISVDYYFYKGSSEIIFFKWEKETELQID